jgi:diguanylate cyclase (GGDEF)-like protein
MTLKQSAIHQALLAEIEELKKENQKLKISLNHDPLTGLFNQKAFREELPLKVAHSKKTGEIASVLFIDVDFLKSINLEHGHLAASQILSKIGRLIHLLVRQGDFACRYAGDEFILIVDGAEVEASILGERIRKTIESTPFRVKGFKGLVDLRVTVSVGIRVMQTTDTPEAVVEQADRALYEAKRRSRNCLVAA